MPNPQRAARQRLDDWKSAGLTHIPKARPGAAVREPVQPVAPAGVKRESSKPESPHSAPAAALPVISKESMSSSLSREKREVALCALAAQVAGCTRCTELAATRTQTVFGVGDPQARVMFIGEAPGADEDAQGEPFVGRAGQLMNRIIAACGWRREELYICNILRCRPPGNRTPSPHEAANCREYLDGQIQIVRPEYIVCWGSCAAQNLLNRTDAIGKLRGQFFEHAFEQGRAKVLCTYHPSYLLRNPSAKKPVWDDMQLLLKEMGLKPPGQAM